jgi:hypothetical protein
LAGALDRRLSRYLAAVATAWGGVGFATHAGL